MAIGAFGCHSLVLKNTSKIVHTGMSLTIFLFRLFCVPERACKMRSLPPLYSACDLQVPIQGCLHWFGFTYQYNPISVLVPRLCIYKSLHEVLGSRILGRLMLILGLLVSSIWYYPSCGRSINIQALDLSPNVIGLKRGTNSILPVTWLIAEAPSCWKSENWTCLQHRRECINKSTLTDYSRLTHYDWCSSCVAIEAIQILRWMQSPQGPMHP